MSEHKSYVPSEDRTKNSEQLSPKILPVPFNEEPEEEQNPFTKYIYVSTGRRKRAKEALIAMWDKLFDSDHEKKDKEQSQQYALAAALAEAVPLEDDPSSRDGDDLEFKLNSWYPAVFIVGAAAVMLNGKI